MRKMLKENDIKTIFRKLKIFNERERKKILAQSIDNIQKQKR